MGLEESFLESVKSGEVAKVRALLESHPLLLESRDEAGVSALLLAAYRGRQEMVDLLLSLKSNLDLFEAAAVGKLGRVQALVQENPAGVNAVSPDGFSPLGLAAFFGHPEVAAYLIEQGADVDAPSRNAARVRPLHSALAHRQPDISLAIAERLVARGAGVNTKQGGGWTPLHQAAIHGQVELARLLLRHGADVNAQAENGKTPLALAETGRHKEMAALLREAGAEERD